MTINEEITAEVQNIITALRVRLPKGGRKQYPAAKHQIAALTDLGIIDAMPRGFGYQDAAEVIAQATSGRRTESALNAEGEGDEWTVEASTLYTLLNPNPAEINSEVPAAPATPAVGDRIFVKEYEALIYFVPPNGVLVNPIRQTTGGYHSTVVQVLAEEIGEDELGKPVYSVSIIDATGREHPVEHVQVL